MDTSVRPLALAAAGAPGGGAYLAVLAADAPMGARLEVRSTGGGSVVGSATIAGRAPVDATEAVVVGGLHLGGPGLRDRRPWRRRGR